MRRVNLAVFASILFLSASAFAADNAPQPLTLGEAQHIALANHPQIKESDLNVKSSEEDITAARSGYYPQVSGNAVRAFADPNTRIAATSGLNNPTVLDRASAGVGISQLITDFGYTGALVDASKAALESQKQRADLSRAAVLLGVTRAYYDVLRAQALLKVAQGTLETRQRLLDQVSSLRNVKMKSDLDLSLANQGINDARLLLLKAQNNHDDAMAELSEALGYGETHVFTLTDDGKVAPPAGTVESLQETALRNNPELAALQSDYDASRKEAEAAGRKFFPTVSAVGFAGDTPVRTADQHIDANYATGGVNISIPIFTGDKLTAEADKAKYHAEALRMRIEIRRNTLIRDIHTAFDSVQTAYKNIALTGEMHKNTSQSLTLTQARYDIGKSSIVDLSQAQLAETQAAVAETDAAYDYLTQQALLAYAVGDFSGDWKTAIDR